MGHPGRQKLQAFSKRDVFCFNVQKVASDVINGCEACIAAKPRRPLIGVIPKPRKFANSPFSKSHFDLWDAGRHDIKNKRYLLGVTDELTKYFDGIPLANKKETTVAEAMLTLIFRHGIFGGTIVTDNGREWASIWRLITEKLELRHIRSAPYNSRANSQIERKFRDFNTMLRVGHIDASKWSCHLPFILFTMNNSPKDVLGGLTPSECLYGRCIQLPLDITPDHIQNDSSFVKYINTYLDKCHRRLAAEHENRYATNNFSNKRGASLEIGCKVFMYTPKLHGGKLTTAYSGPFSVAKRVHWNTYDVKCDKSGATFRRNIRHLRRYTPNECLKIQTNAEEPQND